MMEGSLNINGYEHISDCEVLANTLHKHPISVTVDGSNMQHYRQGIFDNCIDNNNLPLLLVGMTEEYWILKNAWGT